MFTIKKFRKLNITLIVILVTLLLAAAILTYYLKFYKEDLNKNVPMTYRVESEDTKLEDIAYHFWMSYMDPFTGTDVSPWKRLKDVRFNEIQVLAGDEQEFAVAVTFWAQLEKKKWSTHHHWGEVQEDGTIKDIQWTFRIKKTSENEYTLMRIEETTNAISHLDPVKDTYQKDAGITIPNENYRYEISNNTLQITYDNGDNWQKVPVSVEKLFEGDYSGSKTEIIEGSYLITPDKTAFVIGDSDRLKILQTTDKGKHWDKVHVPNHIPGVRLRLINFTSELNGSLIVTGERTMGFEAHAIFLTKDGGKSWVETGHVSATNQFVTSGGFINERLGFLSFGSITVNDELPRPAFYRTADGGINWNEVEIPIPTEYQGIFIEAQMPTFDGTHGTLLVNQGSNGDYQGGKVLLRFTSIDEGKTWFFSNLVDPDNTIEN